MCRDGRYTTIVDRMRPDAARPGDIVDQSGAVVGRHDGITDFTVGQRKGLGLSGNEEPLFVLKLDAAKAQVVVGPRAALASSAIALKEVNWLAPPQDAPFEARVKVRSMRPPVAAQVIPLAGRRGAGGTGGAGRGDRARARLASFMIPMAAGFWAAAGSRPPRRNRHWRDLPEFWRFCRPILTVQGAPLTPRPRTQGGPSRLGSVAQW